LEVNPDIQKAKRYRYQICLIIFLSYILVFFHRLCPAVIALDMQADFEVSSTLLGVLGSAYFYPYAIMQLPTGLLADSWGPRKTVSTFFLLASGGSVLMGLAPNLGLAIIGRVMVGTGVATLFVCNYKLLAEWFCPRRFVIMGGIFMAMGGVGALSSSVPLAWLSNRLGWRMSLVAVGMVTLVMAVLVYARVRNRPEEKGWPSLGPSSPGNGGSRIGLLEGLKQVVTARRFWPISIWSFFAPGLSFALGGLWGGPYLIQVYGLSKTAAGGVLSMFAVALIVGSPVLSALANRFGRKPVLMGCSLLLITVCCIFFQWPSGLPLSLLYVLFFCLTLSGATGAVAAAVSKELFPVTIAGTAVGMVNLFPFFGGALFQIAMGAIISFGSAAERAVPVDGYGMIFLFALAGALSSLVAALLLTETLQGPEKGVIP